MSETKKNETLNQKMAELNQKIGWFNTDEFQLDEATTKYKEAIDLATEIKKDLTEMKNEVEILTEDFTK